MRVGEVVVTLIDQKKIGRKNRIKDTGFIKFSHRDGKPGENGEIMTWARWHAG